MATDILIKRSTTPGAVPTTGDLSTGELAINTADKRLFTNNAGTIVEIGTAPTSLAVTNNTTVGGTLGVTGNTTLSGTLSAGATTLASGSVSGNFSVTGTLTVATPSNSTDAASKGYVDAQVSAVIDSAPAALDTLNELAAALGDDANFATTVTNALAGKLALTGGTMTGDITLGANKITSTATPATDDTLTRKGYVDSILGSATDAATSAAAAASSATDAANSASAASTSASNASTSATNAASSASAASTSATNAATSATAAASSATSASNSATASANSATAAATSATNAENAYDSFDDRYLGAKASDPTVDNDGDALITGALYFDSTNGVMKVYNGSEWGNASSSIEGIKSDFVYTATASQTAFSGADDNTNTLVIDQAGLVNVFLNGVRLVETTDYTINVSTNTVTLVSGAALNDIVEIEVFGNFAGQSGASVAITGGVIDGTTIGGTTPAAGTFTTFTSTGIDDNASATAVTIDASGNVGIGRTPSYRLDMNSSTGVAFRVVETTTGNTGRFQAGVDSGLAFIEAEAGAGSMGLGFKISNSEKMRIDSSGNVGIGTTPSAWSTNTDAIQLGNTGGGLWSYRSTGTSEEYVQLVNNTYLNSSSANIYVRDGSAGQYQIYNNQHRWYQAGSGTAGNTATFTQAMTLDSSGNLLVGSDSAFSILSSTDTGFNASPNGIGKFYVSANVPLFVGRQTNDGILVDLRQAGVTEGSISVSGTTVSYNGGHLARWSRLADDSKDTSIVKGTVMTNLDEMVVWSHDAIEAQDAIYDEDGNVISEAVEAKEAYIEDNEQLNKMAVSSVEGDPNVAGVFVNWDEDDDDFNDMNIAMTGDMVIRIAQGTTVQRGDLLMSAGDGTAKPQGDDIVRSKTIAKVTSTHVSHTYDDGSYLVPCVLMAC